MSSQRNAYLHEHYTPLVTDARARIINDPILATVMSRDAEPELVLAFLIYFSALGVEMTRHVDAWIARAGHRCLELGHTQLGAALVKHARHEAGHHNLMIEDLRLLVPRWNQLHEVPLAIEPLLALTPTDSMRRYAAIHEHTIAGPTPYGQIAIEYEIEGMSVILGPALLDACSRALGPEIVAEMSFIREHAALDIGHTAMNAAELDKFLRCHPEDAKALARIGGDALHIYLDFLCDCVDMARTLIGEY
jgi:hypothetical protein